MPRKSTIIEALGLMDLGFPGRLPGNKEKMIEAWTMFLDGMDDKAIVEATKDLCSQPREYPPSVGQVRHRAAELSMGMLAPPSAVEAWENVTNLSRGKSVTLQEEEKRALDFVGGTWAVKNSEKPEIMRSQFMKAYQEYIEKKIVRGRSHQSTKALAEGNAPKLPAPKDRPPQGVEQCLSCDKWFPPSALYNGVCYNCQPPGHLSSGSKEYQERVSSLLDLVPGYREQYPRPDR